MMHISLTDRRLLCVLAWLCLSCSGRDIVLGDRRDESGGEADAGEGDADESDAGEPGAGRPFSPFSELEPIDGIASDDSIDDDPSLTADLTLLYFNSERSGGKGEEDIWFTSRDSASAAWSEPQPAVELNSDRRETGIALSPDGLTIWFSSDRHEEDGTLDIFSATRTSRDEPFSAPERVEALSSTEDDLVSAFDPGEGTIYLSRRGEGEDYALYAAARAGDSFEPPLPLQELDADGAESDAFPADGAQFLFFTRDGDLAVARRRRAADPFTFAFALGELNTSDDERDAWVSQDLSYIVFSSDRDGEYRLYEARR